MNLHFLINLPFLLLQSIGLNFTISNNFLVGDVIFNPTDKILYNQLSDYLDFKYSEIDPYLVSEHRLLGLSSNGNNAYYNQYDESVFYKSENGANWSEGNCGLVSTANALAYYKTYGSKYQFPAATNITNIIPQANYSVFSYAISHGYAPKSSNVPIHTIYAKERDYAISVGYNIGGLTNSQTEYFFESTCSYYGYNNSDFDGLNDCNPATLMNELDNNRPLQIRTSNDNAYGSHGMMATGYKYYSCAVYNEIYDIYVTKYLLLVSVFDGSTTEKWYDIPGCTGLPDIYQRADNVTIAKMIVA